MTRSLHPDIKQFKKFVKENPYVLKDVRKGNKTLQDLFEEWQLFGEEDEIWDTYREPGQSTEESSSGEETNNSSNEEDVIAMLKKMNLNDIQYHLAQFGTVIESVQQLISQFRQQTNSEDHRGQEQPPPFSFRDD